MTTELNRHSFIKPPSRNHSHVAEKEERLREELQKMLALGRPFTATEFNRHFGKEPSSPRQRQLIRQAVEQSVRNRVTYENIDAAIARLSGQDISYKKVKEQLGIAKQARLPKDLVSKIETRMLETGILTNGQDEQWKTEIINRLTYIKQEWAKLSLAEKRRRVRDLKPQIKLLSK